MADKPVFSDDQIVAQLTRLGVWNAPASPIAYAFLEQRPSYLPYESSFAPFSASERAGAVKAFGLIAEVASLSFVQVADNGLEPGPSNQRITFRTVSVEQPFYSGSASTYQYDDSPDIYGADIILNHNGMDRRVEMGGYFHWPSYVTIHEILHSIGLSHPGDYDGAGYNYDDHAQFQQDTRQYSVMSYWDVAETGADHIIGSTQYVAQTPLLYDILALQRLYGANMATRAGDTVYGFNSNTGSSPFNFAVNAAPVIAIWDGGGRDRLDFSGWSEASVIDLNDGAFSSGGGLTKNIAVAFGAVIEEAVGGAGNDVLIGNAAANRLDGGAGADSMTGGLGNDVFIVDQAGDAAIEAAGGGVDLVRTLVSFTLAPEIEDLVLEGGNALNATGNALANRLGGNAGANVLDGRGGSDTMTGGGGNDVFLVDHVRDSAIESAGGGIDLVRSRVSFTLAREVENLILDGSAAINGAGNGLANRISGNAAANILNGGGGGDTMTGGDGNDIYHVDAIGDAVVEVAGAHGIDRVDSAISYTLGRYVENLTLTGTRATSATGNGLANVLTGNASANVLKGGAGADSLAGNGGNDRLFGGTGKDVLRGDSGQDGFYFDSALSASSNVDRILDFSHADDTIFLDRDVFSAITANGVLSAAAFRAGTAARDSTDRIIHDQKTGALYYDADGLGGAAQVMFADVGANRYLTHADFIAFI